VAEQTKKTILFDFDGTIHSYTSGWRGADVIPDAPIEGIREELTKCQQDFHVVIFSTRALTEKGRNAMEAWLTNWQIPYDMITDRKVPALVLVDDRAICFDGVAAGLYEKVKGFRTWQE
jgi:FMN phosphatase YigB (HAD superfamily)